MKTNTRKTTLASIRNSYGARVFIPEKGSLNRRLWVKPYSFTGISVVQSYPMLISFTNTTKLSLRIASIKVVLTSPFTHNLLLHYINKAAAGSQSSDPFAMPAHIQNDTLLSKENKAKFDLAKKRIPLEDAKLIYTLGDAVFTRDNSPSMQ